MHAIDILASNMDSVDNNQLFHPDFSRQSSASELAKKSKNLANEANEENDLGDEASPLDYFLDPQALEGGWQSHSHVVTVKRPWWDLNPDHHGGVPFTIIH